MILMKKNKYNFELLLGVLSVFLIPLNKHFVTIALCLWFLVSLYKMFSHNDKIKFISIFNRNKLPILLFPIFYIIHLFGLLYTENYNYAFFDLEIKLSMFVIPLIILMRYDFYTNKQNYFLKALIFGCLVSFLINIIIAFINYYKQPLIAHFFYTNLSAIHPSYMALYVSTSLIIVLFLGYNKIIFSNKIAKVFGIIIFIILFIYLLLLSSKAGIIAFTIAVTVYFVNLLARKIKAKYIILIALLSIISPFLLLNFIPSVKDRFQAMNNAIINSSEASIDSEESSMERVAIFVTSSKFAYNCLPWGVGTGDTKDKIIENYKKMGSQTVNERYLNPHNQYLHSTITLGVFGLFVLLLIVIVGFRIAIKNKSVLFLSFIILISLNMLFESMLEQQAGVIFIALFYSLFIVWSNDKSFSNNKISD